MGTGGAKYRLGPILRMPITQVTTGAPGQGTDHCTHPRLDIPPRRLTRLQVHVQGPMVSLRVELFHQGQQARGLAGLAWGMEDEIAFLPDQTPDFVYIPTIASERGLTPAGRGGN